MRIKTLKSSQLSLLPRRPGVYLFYEKKIPLYIGKASNLKERVKNHFKQPNYKDNLFIGQVKKIGYIPLKSEVEALILESQLIKKYQPKFNVLFRDDKNYFYVGFTSEDWPRVFITHQPKNEPKKLKSYKLKADYVGPFVGGTALKETLKILRKIFPYRSCKTMPKKPCLWYELNRCPAPCLIEREIKEKPDLKKQFEERRKDYKNNIKKLKLILKEGGEKLISTLKKEMNKMAKLQEFEKAAKIRDKIGALKEVFSHKMLFYSLTEKDYYSPIISGLQSREAILEENLSHSKNIGLLFKKSLNLPKIPKRIEGYDISNIKGKEMVGSMIVFKFSRICANPSTDSGQVLGTNLCEYKYVPDKKNYRRFKIRMVKSQNDIACLKEVISRRLSHPEWKIPDLIYVDGGKGQLNAIKSIVDSYWREKLRPFFFPPHRKTGSKATARNRGCLVPGVGAKKPPIISLAKRRNILYNSFSDKSLPLDNFPEEVKMILLYLRDEAHRFAIFYHRKLHSRKTIELV